MLKVNNKKALRDLSKGSLKSNTSRNIIAILAIALTTLLFTALFTIGSGMIENFQRQTMRQAGGDGMGVLKYITDEEYENIRNHELIEEISYNRLMSNSIDNPELLKRHGELYYMDDTAMKLSFCEPTEGRKPQAENEIIMDTKTIQLLGAEQKIGAPVTIRMTVHGQQVSRQFVLSGWWEADPVFNVSIMVTSRAYMEAHMDELYNSMSEDHDMTGAINSYLMFKNSWNLEEKMERVITESGYSSDENHPNYIVNNVNWSYLSANLNPDPSTVIAVIAALLLITFTGYLIIYNIFQISVIRDIRFYGLLKTIGTTGRQIRRMIRRQALLLSCIGIPIGLLFGYLLGCRIVPVILDQSFYASSSYETSVNPWIFLGSILFSLVTVLISTSKPGRIAAKVSPVEAVRYTEAQVSGRTRKGLGTKLSGMARANLGRNKKRTVLVLLSMSLSLILFNTIYTFSIGFDMDKYLSKFVDTDYLIAHADYFNYEFFGEENSVSEEMIQAVSQQPGFEEGGRIYANRDAEYFAAEDPNYAGLESNKNKDGNVSCMVYGCEDLPLRRLQVIEGEIDMEKLKTGKYIIEGIQLDDNGEPKLETSHYEIGDKVILHNRRGSDTSAEGTYQTYEFEVMAKIGISHYTNSCGIGYDYSFYLPAESYLQMTDHPGTMNYSYNVADSEESTMEEFLKAYTENIEPTMNYSSKSTRAKEFEGMRNMVLLVGGALSLIIGLIGILNFVNSMLTSILTRRREFAMLQSIGMTTKQLRSMLIIEGLYYTAAAGILSLSLGSILSLIVADGLLSNFWFFSYQFTLTPLLLVIPLLLILGILIPIIVLHTVNRQSIVERLRETE